MINNILGMEKEEWDRLTKLHKIVPISNKSKLKELEKEVLYYKLKAGENTIYKILSELPVLIQEIKRLTFLTKRKSKIVNTIGKVSEIQIDIARNTNIRNYININSSKKAHCLFHSDRNESMHVYNNKYYCFSCNAHGSVIDIVMKLNNVDFIGAIKLINNI